MTTLHEYIHCNSRELHHFHVIAARVGEPTGQGTAAQLRGKGDCISIHYSHFLFSGTLYSRLVKIVKRNSKHWRVYEQNWW